ncbi:MAG: macro domain-containing protein [Acholeplasmatales bacterium]|nr:macro domain-containing protein [Acholeplasmatales bacterium]
MYEDFLIDYLTKYNNLRNAFVEVNKNDRVRALMNITMPYNLSDEFYQKEGVYLKSLLAKKSIINVENLEFKNNISFILGDITLIDSDAIVNACNSRLLGCLSPLHYCVDNAIHSFAGLEVRRDLLPIMEKQNGYEKNGKVKVTKGYNLPSKFIFHTVGPRVAGIVSEDDKIDLENSYLSCLKKACEMNLETITFPSISTGVFAYPIQEASKLAVETVKKYLAETTSKLKVVFILHSEKDYNVYKELLES